MSAAPVPFEWDGEAFRPRRGFAKVCDGQFVIGETYTLAPIEARSAASHRHFFAAVHEAWTNLPEDKAAEYPTSEHFRKRALIMSGFASQRDFVASSKAEALRLAAFIRPVDEYALIQVVGNVVREFRAASQSERAMGKAEFQKSKDAVLTWCAAQIGVDIAELRRNAA